MGITWDTDNVYVVDPERGELAKMDKDGGYTLTVYTGAGTNPCHIHHPLAGNTLYWVTWGATRDSTSTIESIATASLGGAGAIVPTEISDGTGEPLKNASCIHIQSAANVFVFSDTHDHIVKYSDLVGTVSKYYPGKISLTAEGQELRDNGTYNNLTGDESYFYAISIVDIWGQESHLMHGAMCVDDATTRIFVKIWMNILSEDYEEQSASVASGITALNSRWNDFRRIDKIRIYRAYSSTFLDKEPASNYRFLKEIDFDDSEWAQVTANGLYSLTFTDDTTESDISTLSYEESSGYPEYFKPYYTNWKFAIEQNSIYYYGNIRTDALYIQKFLKSPKNAPDMITETDINSEVFGVDDGDEIKGFGKTLSRIYVFKENTTALFNGLDKDRDYTVGCYAPESIVNWRDLIYFVAKDGIYILHPTGEKKISLPIDEIFLSKSDISTVSGALFTEKEKIIFAFANNAGDTFVYNYVRGTWDYYTLSNALGSPQLLIQHIRRGIDGRILFSSQGSSAHYVYEFNTGYTDGADYDGTGGNAITAAWTSNHIGFAEDAATIILRKLWASFKNGTDSLSITLYYIHESSTPTALVTLGTNSELIPKEFYLNEAYLNTLYMIFSNQISVETIIDNFIFEYDIID
jgi:hypothetical protein